MLIDLTRRPVIIQPDECKGHVIVRTIASRTVTGLLTQRLELNRSGTRTHTPTLRPGASLQRGPLTCLETRLHLDNFEDALADPYEVATGSYDLLTNVYREDRLKVQVRFRTTGVWLVTVSPHDAAPFLAITVKDLALGRGILGAAVCEFPLSRRIQKVAQTGIEQPTNVWSRLAGTEE